MPALYRMPVFYLLVLVGASLYAIGRASAPPPPAEPVAEVPQAPPRINPDVVEVEGGGGDSGILRTAAGLRRKVVVKDLAVVCRAEPGNGRAVGPPLDYFAIRYVFGEAPGQFQVGPRGGPAQGWVPATAVLEWETRLMARPTARAGRPPLVIYRDEACLADAAAGRPCTQHPGGCPTEGEEAAGSGADATAEAPPLGFPILGTKVVEGRTIFEVASLVRDSARVPILPAEPPPDLRPYLKVVDVAFAIDTTKSMQGPIDAARKLAAGLAETAARLHGDVTLRFALVEYRDVASHYGFRARRVTPFTDAAGFLASLRRTTAATRGDGSVDEQVFDGVALALPPGPNDPPGEHVEWPTGRAGELATKLLVLMGDAPDHARDLGRAGELAERARAAGITIATVAIDRPGVLSRDESARYRDQWRTLAAGSYLPLDKATEFASPIAPLALSLQDGDRLAERLRALIDDRIEHARTLAALATAEAEGKLAAYVDSRGLTLDRVGPVLVDLHKGDAARVARPDPRYDGRKAPSVRRGWIAERLADQAMVTVEILMTRDELTTLIGELGQLQQAASGTARDLTELLQIGTAAASGETSFLAADRGSRTFADHLRRRGGLPPSRPDSLLGRNQGDLLRADDLTLAALQTRLGASLLQLTRRLQATDWTDPRRTIDGMALIPFDAIDF